MTALIDSTVVNVAVGYIREDLRISYRLLAWVMNAYFVLYGGALLICGRLGDYYGHARLFLIGMAVFTFASVGCAVAWSPAILIGMRAVQGLGAAAIQAVTVPLIMESYRGTRERASAIGLVTAVGLSGASAGILLGGVITSTLGWRWIFAINIPIGILSCGLMFASGRAGDPGTRAGNLSMASAILVTASLILFLSATASATQTGLRSLDTSGLLLGATLLLCLFLAAESRATSPIAPLELFDRQNFRSGFVANALLSCAQFVWFFITTLYLQESLGYDAWHVSLAFLPANIVAAIFSASVSKWLIAHFGMRWPITAGPLLVALGLAFLSLGRGRAGSFADVLPAMVLVGMGSGLGFNTLVSFTLSDLSAKDYGIGSGLISSSSVMCSCLTISILANFISARASSAVAAGGSVTAATTTGFHAAFAAGAALAIVTAVVGGIFMSPTKSPVSSTD